MLPIADDRILIVGRTQAGRILSSPTNRQGIDAVISIGDVTEQPPAGFRYVSRRLRLIFEDEVSAATGGPSLEDISSIIDFGRTIDFQKNRVLIHCQAGISRSSAAAVIVLAAVFGAPMIREIANFLRRVYPNCSPNQLMLRLADIQLDTGGALQRAWPDSSKVER
jgi:predicted protein tyrosine phosphatase